MSGGKGDEVIVGYRYFIGMHHILCYGPIGALLEIRAGEREAWTGNLTSSQSFQISAPELFGGKEREGGFGAIPVQDGTGTFDGIIAPTFTLDHGGEVDLLMGESTQPINPYLESVISALLPAYRGVCSLVFKGFYIGNNPYLKNIEYKVKNIPIVLGATDSDIGGHANPAHIIYEVLTNKDWGMGYTINDIDTVGFQQIASVLAGEGFGLSFVWTQSNSIEEFVNEVLRHINGSLYLNRGTGKFVLKLIRDDYTLSAEPVFDETNIVEMKSFARRTWGETVNEVKVTYRDSTENEDRIIMAQDLANIQIQGTTVSTTIQYPGIPDGALASKVALRDLATLTAPLAKLVIKVNREAWDLPPGAIFAFEWAKLGISQMAMRVGAIDYGTINDAFITINAIEDIFGLPSTSYTQPQSSEWIDPFIDPADATNQFRREATYWETVQVLGDADAEALATGAGFLVVLAGKPSIGHFNWELWTATGSATVVHRDTASFAPSGTMILAMGSAVSTVFTYENDLGMTTVALGDLMQIDGEICQITGHSRAVKSITVDRGMIDTIPVPHVIDTRFYVISRASLAADITEYADTEVVDYFILTITSRGTLSFANSTGRTYTMQGRIHKPYPPGNLRVEGGAAFDVAVMSLADFDIFWSHRDRTQQTQQVLILQDAGSIGPEAGVVYNLRLYNEDDVLSKTENGISGDTYVWTSEVADSGFGRLNSKIRIELESDNSGELSILTHDYTVDRADYGYSYGKYYGGVT